MSQAKVDKYKKEKAHRKQEMRKEKLERIAVAAGGVLLAAAICVWIGFSIYHQGDSNTSTTAASTDSSVEADTSAVSDYLNDLSAEE